MPDRVVADRRILLKLSGEALGDPTDSNQGLSLSALDDVAAAIADVVQLGVRVGIVIGGGNFVRGREWAGSVIRRVTADRIGMLGTVINALALCDVFKASGFDALVQSPFRLEPLTRLVDPDAARAFMAAGGIVIFAGGTGHPYFSTDTAAALYGVQIGAERLYKATNVDGVYDRDPNLEQNARWLPTVSFQKVLADNLAVMDAAAVAICQANGLPVVVFNFTKRDNLRRLIMGENIGTCIS